MVSSFETQEPSKPPQIAPPTKDQYSTAGGYRGHSSLNHHIDISKEARKMTVVHILLTTTTKLQTFRSQKEDESFMSFTREFSYHLSRF